MLPKVSIITRTRDRAVLLRRAAASVGGQTYADWEWIVVNDAGEVGPVEAAVAETRAADPQKVRTLHLGKSSGMEHASNAAIRLARGELLVIHDDDDSWEPAFLEEMVAWLESPARVAYAGVVCQSIRVVEEWQNGEIRILEEQPFNPWLEQIHPWRLISENPFPPISFLFRRKIWEQLGGFDESLPVLGDWEFNVRCLLHAPIGVLPLPLARYHHRPPTETGAMANSITAGHDRHRQYEEILRQRWLQQAPVAGLPYFGALSRMAGLSHAEQRRRETLISLPIRPGLRT